MKQLPLIFLLLAPCLLLSQTTYVPDDVFEDYLETNIPGCNNGVAGDNLVLTEGMESIFSFVSLPTNIADFTGIQACNNLFYLIISGNEEANVLDLSGITGYNTLEGGQYMLLEITNCPNLVSLTLPSTNILVNCSYNSQLVNVSCEPGCELHSSAVFSSLNSMTDLDLSNASVNPGATMAVSYNSSLMCVNLNNGDCFNWSLINFWDNPSLSCVQVDNPTFSSNASSWVWYDHDLDPISHAYSANCNCGSVGIDEGILSHQRNIVAIYDLLGRETVFQHNVPLIYLYDDGTREKRIACRSYY